MRERDEIMTLMELIAGIPQWVIMALGVIFGTFLFWLGYYFKNLMRARQAPQLPDELKVRCPVCGGTELKRWDEVAPNYIEYKCRECGHIFYPK